MCRLLLSLISLGTIVAVVEDCPAQSFHTAKAKSPEAGTVFIYPERLQLAFGAQYTGHRGLMFVPLKRDNPDSDVIAVEFFRFPRLPQSKKETPPVFLLQGGPGFVGLKENFSRIGTFEMGFSHLVAISDVVIVGQRGIGSSKPNTIIDESTKRQPADRPFDEAKEIKAFQNVLARERDYWLDQGVDLSGFNVLEAAADVRDVAAALGYEKIIVQGGSFGSHVGMAVMRAYPELVERAVLTGMEGPDHTWDHPGHIWNVYKRVAEDAEASAKLKDLIPEGGLAAALESIVAKADKDPFMVTLRTGKSKGKKVLLDGDAMRRFTRSLAVGLHAWPAEVIQMHRGNFEAPASRHEARARSQGREFSTASYWMLDSGSGISAQRRAEYESDPAMKVIGGMNWDYASGSPVWQADLGEDFRQGFQSSVPTVIVHGTWDRRTPYENALELAPYFRNRKLVTVKRGTHGAMREASRYFSSFRPALMKFMVTGDMSDLPEDLELPIPNWVVPKTPQ